MATQNASSFLREMTSSEDLSSAINNQLQAVADAKDKYLDKYKKFSDFDFGVVFPALQGSGAITMATDTAKQLGQMALDKLSNGINNQIASNFGANGLENADDVADSMPSVVVDAGNEGGTSFMTAVNNSGNIAETSFDKASDSLEDAESTTAGNVGSEGVDVAEGLEGATEGTEVAEGVEGASEGLEAVATGLSASGVGALVGVVLGAVAGLTDVGIEAYKESHQSAPQKVIRPTASFQLGINA